MDTVEQRLELPRDGRGVPCQLRGRLAEALPDAEHPEQRPVRLLQGDRSQPVIRACSGRDRLAQLLALPAERPQPFRNAFGPHRRVCPARPEPSVQQANAVRIAQQALRQLGIGLEQIVVLRLQRRRRH